MAARLVPVHWTFLAGFTGLMMLVGLLAGVNPKFAIAASLAVGFVLVVTADLTAGLAVFSFSSFLELLGESSVVSVGKLGGAFLALGWIAYIATRDDAKSDFISVYPGASMALGVFLGWVALSSVWAESSVDAQASFFRYLLNVVLFMIVFTAVRTRQHATLVIGGFLAGAAVAAVYGQVAGSATETYGARVTGAGLDPNELASVLVAGVALAAGMVVAFRGKPGLRLAVMGAGALCLLTALSTGSRGGLVALVCMLVAAVLFGGRWRGRVTAAGLAVAFLATFYIFALAPQSIRDHVFKSSTGERKVPEYRTTLWQVGGRMFEANPVLGVGSDNFQVSSRHYLFEPGVVHNTEVIIETPGVAHNTYLHVAAELGAVGIGLFAAIIVFSLTSCLKAARNFARRGDIKGDALARAAGIALVAVLAADFFISQQYNKQLWLLLGLGPALLAISLRSDPEGEEN